MDNTQNESVKNKSTKKKSQSIKDKIRKIPKLKTIKARNEILQEIDDDLSKYIHSEFDKTCYNNQDNDNDIDVVKNISDNDLSINTNNSVDNSINNSINNSYVNIDNVIDPNNIPENANCNDLNNTTNIDPLIKVNKKLDEMETAISNILDEQKSNKYIYDKKIIDIERNNRLIVTNIVILFLLIIVMIFINSVSDEVFNFLFDYTNIMFYTIIYFIVFEYIMTYLWW
jgi:hypothetical protein